MSSSVILVRFAPIPSVLVRFGRLWHRVDLKPGVGFWLSCSARIGWSPHTTTIWRPELDPGFYSSTLEPVWSPYCLLPLGASCVRRKDFRGEQWVPYRQKSYWIRFDLFATIERASFKATKQLWIDLERSSLLYLFWNKTLDTFVLSTSVLFRVSCCPGKCDAQLWQSWPWAQWV